jgi:hypothetical protein
VPTEGKAAQVSTVFAMKAAWQAGLWEAWPETRRLGCIEFLKSFQRPDGWFADPWLAKASRPNVKKCLRHALHYLSGTVTWRELFHRTHMNLRAETRQSVATLLMVQEAPPYSLPLEHNSVEGIKAFLNSFDWHHPWSAGSHLSHLIFFLAINQHSFEIRRNYEALIEVICKFLASIRDPETGCWFRGNPTDTIKINGAMKVFSGLQWVDQPYPDCTRLLDFALELPFQTDGCGFVNHLFVVHEAMNSIPDRYRYDQIKSLALKALEAIVKFQKPDGGFSFYQKHAQTGYYGATVSRGLPVSDLHGTYMMVWALSLALEMLGDDAPAGREQWQAQRG